VLIRREYKSSFLPCSSLGSESSECSEPPNCTEPKPSDRAGGPWRASAFDFGAAFRGEEIELLRAMRQAAQAYAQEADFAAMVTMLANKRFWKQRRCRRQSCVGSPSVFARCRYRSGRNGW